MLKYIKKLILMLVVTVNFSYAANMSPTTWEDLIGTDNLGMLFVGNSIVYGRSDAYVANVAEDTSLFETIVNPRDPEKYQKYRLTPEGLFYDLHLNHHVEIQGVLPAYEKQESEDEIIWIFKGTYAGEGRTKGKGVIHKFIFEKEIGALNIVTFLDGHKHAEVSLAPQTRFYFYSNYIINLTKNIFSY